MFDEDAWPLVIDIMKNKKEQCTCPAFKSLISGKVTSCSFYKSWFHGSCIPNANLSKKQWLCEKCADPAVRKSIRASK